MSTTSAPPSAAPSTTAAAIVGACTRVSRPTAISPRLELLHVRTADRVRAFFVEFLAVDAADVVRLEDLRFEHEPMLWNTADLRGPRPTQGRTRP